MKSAAQHQPFDLLKMDRKIDTRTRLRRVAKLAAWGGVAALGLKRGGVIGFLVAAFGVVRGLRVLAGGRPIREWIGSGPAAAPSGDPGLRDPVDEASWESFPASDPPGIS